MILTTTNSIEGHKIILTAVPPDNGPCMQSVDKVKETAFQRLQDHAAQLKANAVVGIKVEIELTTSNYPMVSVTGTAVKVAV